MRLARYVTNALAPAYVAGALLVIVATASAATALEALLWSAVTLAFVVAVPYGYVLRAVRRGGLSDKHVKIRSQRRIPLLIGIVCVTVALIALMTGDAPQELTSTVLAILVGAVVAFGVSLRWKISVHTSTVSAAIVVLAVVLGTWALLLLPLVVLVGWARVRLGDHTVAQVVAGAMVGAGIAGVVLLATL